MDKEQPALWESLRGFHISVQNHKSDLEAYEANLSVGIFSIATRTRPHAVMQAVCMKRRSKFDKAAAEQFFNQYNSKQRGGILTNLTKSEQPVVITLLQFMPDDVFDLIVTYIKKKGA